MSHPTSPVESPAINYPGVTSVEAISGYRLILKFDNGEQRLFDVTPLLITGRFQTLTSPGVFEKVHVSFDAVEWENGLDLDPEYLYLKSEKVTS